MQINKTFMDATSGLRQIGTALAVMQAMDIPMKADKPGIQKEKKKTQKGAVHTVGSVFLGRKILKFTHAEYRQKHVGAVKVTPNYRKPSPKPKARNVGVRNGS